MTRQNRVLPTGEIVALPFRGSLTGNRGILHDEHGRLGRARWRHKAWIACRLEFKGWRRPIMAPGRWTELFFWDEAVALAAGHRPCAFCRREDFNRFRAAWADALGGPNPSAPDMDRALHAARIDQATRQQRRFRARLSELPDGVVVLSLEDRPALLWTGELHPYLDKGYGDPTRAQPDQEVLVLTPTASVAAIKGGYAVSVRLPPPPSPDLSTDSSERLRTSRGWPCESSRTGA